MFPAEEKIGELRRALAANRDTVFTAPPGSGKTTCIPPALLDEPWLEGRSIVMLEPRRLAARNCASYIASRLGEEPGGTVGYQVRLERRVSRRTRLEIVTEGILSQRILSDPELQGVGLVVFDEFHERSLQCDLAFALALDVRRALRPDMRLLAMSATLDAEGVAARLGPGTAVVRADGRLFPVETRYLGDAPLSAAVAAALRETDGDVLCFLPGEGEIRRAAESLGNIPGCEILPLYGALPKEEQDRVFMPGRRRKIVLATSIAETSLTVEGVTAVVDSGLMRVPRFSPSTGMTGLATLPLTLDRAEQRRGRAGRVRPGVCYRLWSEASEASRPKKSTPEILDADLCGLVLASAAWGATRRDGLPWMTEPPAAAWERASSLLRALGAVNGDGRLTAKGERMAKMPMHPRLANMILGAGPSAALLAAIVEEGRAGRETDIRAVADEILETPNRPASKRILRLARRFSQGDEPKVCDNPGAALALAYPDRIAKNRGNGTFRMSSGRGVAVDQTDALAKAPFIVCCEVDDRPGDARLFLGCPVGKDEIEELFSGEIAPKTVCEWNRQTERVDCLERRMFGVIALGEKPLPPDAPGVREAVAEALVAGVRAKGVANLQSWTPETEQLRERCRFVAKTMNAECAKSGAAPWPEMDDAAFLAALPAFVGGMSKWRDLERLPLAEVMDAMLAKAGHSRRELDRLAPERIALPNGARPRVRYGGDEPTVETRLQDCFGMMETPRIAGGKVPVVMTLLSPARRPVQVTKDLAGFWRGAYALVRKEMRGRYPKHRWPEDPTETTAPAAGFSGRR